MDELRQLKMSQLFGLKRFDDTMETEITRQNIALAVPMSIISTLVGIYMTTIVDISIYMNIVCLVLMSTSLLIWSLGWLYLKKRFIRNEFILFLQYVYMFSLLRFGVSIAVNTARDGDNMVAVMTALVCMLCIFQVRPVFSCVVTLSVTIEVLRFMDVLGEGAIFNVPSYLAFLFFLELASIVRFITSVRSIKATEIIREVSLIDTLTGSNNRHAFRSNFDRMVGRDLCVMMADIDDFKHFNDKYGHDQGDRILIAFAEALKKNFGAHSCYRYGGDEFIIVSDTNWENFRSSAEQAIAEFRIDELNAKKDPVSCSMGAVHGPCTDQSALRELLKNADAKLYEAKEKGKNQLAC